MNQVSVDMINLLGVLSLLHHFLKQKKTHLTRVLDVKITWKKLNRKVNTCCFQNKQASIFEIITIHGFRDSVPVCKMHGCY